MGLASEATREANEDALTGLPNRRPFDARIAREIDRAKRRSAPLCVALVDLDHFGEINRAHGYPTGDRALRAFAAAARSSVRATDWIARYGGEELCLVMPDTCLSDACDVAERVRVAVEKVVVKSLAGREVRFTASMGVAELEASDHDAASIVQRGGSAAQRGKQAGRNRVERA